MKVLSLVSGKGGAGKTSLSLGFSKFLTKLGLKVLLIDFDLITFGASLFFDLDKKQPENKKGIVELLKLDKVSLEKIQIEDITYNFGGFQFIPSKVNLNKPSSKLVERSFPKIQNVFKKIMDLASKKTFDIIIIDTQAGPVESAKFSTEFTSEIIVVAEPDPVSIKAGKNYYKEIDSYTKLRHDRLYFLLNKVFRNEAAISEAAINYFTLFEHLNPLPFDMEIRKSFHLGEIPVDVEVPSAFLFCLIRLQRTLYPDLKSDIDKFYEESKNTAFYKIDKLYEKFINDKESIDKKLFNLSKIREKIKLESILIKSSFITIIIASSIFFINTNNFIAEKYFLNQNSWKLFKDILTFSGFLGIVLTWSIPLIKRYSKKREDRLSSTEFELKEQLEHIQEKLNQYEVAKITQEDELLLKIKE